jgi:hypothetical protein
MPNKPITDWPSIRDAIAANDGALAQPPSEQEIVQAESELGASFPSSYRRFIAEIGASDWPEAILGLGHNIAPGDDVVLTNLSERSEMWPPMPLHLLAFSPDGWGNHYCIDTLAVADGDGPVVLWNHNLAEDQVPEVTHQSFLDWLIDMSGQRLEGDRGIDGGIEKT